MTLDGARPDHERRKSLPDLVSQDVHRRLFRGEMTQQNQA
jgi:hypothetical protein